MIRPYVRRGSRPGDETFYLHIPREFVRALDIKPDDQFELKVETKDGELTLCYRRLRK